MTAIETIREIENLGVDVYVRPGGELLLRSRTAREPVPKLAIAYAQVNRGNLAALGTEYCLQARNK